MRAERFGSYSIAATLAGTPTLSRLKSMIRYRRLCPPPRWRSVMRPRLFRPPDLRKGAVSDGSGSVLVISLKSNPVWKRRPGDVGRYCNVGIPLGPLEEVDAAALGERHVGLFPVGSPSEVSTDAPDLAELAARPHLLDPDLEKQLHRAPDLDLVGPWMNPEHDLVPELVHQRALLGDDRALHDIGGVHAYASSPSRSRATTRSRASRVKTTAAVPARRDASWLRTTSCSRDSRSGPARTAAGTSTSPTLLPPCETTGTVIRCSAMRLPTRLGPLANEDRPPPGAGNRPAHEKEMLLPPNRDHLEVADGDPFGAVAASHSLTLEHPTGVRAVADRSAVPEVLVSPVRAGEAREVVSLHDARGTVALAHATHVDALARAE